MALPKLFFPSHSVSFLSGVTWPLFDIEIFTPNFRLHHQLELVLRQQRTSCSEGHIQCGRRQYCCIRRNWTERKLEELAMQNQTLSSCLTFPFGFVRWWLQWGCWLTIGHSKMSKIVLRKKRNCPWRMGWNVAQCWVRKSNLRFQSIAWAIKPTFLRWLYRDLGPMWTVIFY